MKAEKILVMAAGGALGGFIGSLIFDVDPLKFIIAGAAGGGLAGAISR